MNKVQHKPKNIYQIKRVFSLNSFFAISLMGSFAKGGPVLE